MPKFVPRQRKHKARARQQNGTPSHEAENGDPNALELLPTAQREREEKKRKLKHKLKGQQKISVKKQKRLDKYIDSKLKKEENLELIKKLTQTKVDTSLFRSSKKLGRVSESKREALSRALKERRAGIEVEKNDEVLLEPRRINENGNGDEDASELEEQEDNTEPSTIPVEQQINSFGSGLKRPLELDENGRPIIKKRKVAKAEKIELVTEEPEWEGFSSEDEDKDGEEHDHSESESLSNSDGNDSAATDSSHDGGELDGSGESEESNTDTDVSLDSDDKRKRKERSSAFKSWATQQRNKVIGFIPSGPITNGDIEQTATIPKVPGFVPRPKEDDPLPPELEIKTKAEVLRKAYHVTVDRSQDIQEARLALPVVAEEQKIMEAVFNNDVIVVWGATGSGKTTQVPQFLYEAGYGDPKGPTPGMIGVTQPRRVAAVSMAKRVGEELGRAKEKVSYQIRFESSVSAQTAVKFMTDGVLLREIAQDFALRKYSAIVIDEAHERSVNTDILIGMMSRIVDLRSTMSNEDPTITPLKLIIMSATLRISDFIKNERLFRKGSPPLLQAEGRQYPVTIHFSRRTQRDYLEEAFRKISRGHKKLPPGGILVFLTGQNEITTLLKRLKATFASTQGDVAKQPPVRVSSAEAPLEVDDFEFGTAGNDFGYDSDSEAEIHGLDDEDDDKEFDIGEEDDFKPDQLKVHVLPLYSQLPTQQQLRVFEKPPDGSRLIVIATNVAETSLTIPGIRYVFDCGRSKEKKYDPITGVQSFEIGWISKASASQRAGRAGRTGPGHCYRLYSSAVFERDFEEYAVPEILRAPIDGIVLQLKSMNLQHVVNFPFPTPPDRHALAKAEKMLTYLGAISLDGKVTGSGRELALYPLSPRFARMLYIGQKRNCTAYAIALIAALAVPDIFVPQNQVNFNDNSLSNDIDEEEREQHRKDFNRAQSKLSGWDRTSDALKLLTAICAFAAAPSNGREAFTTSMFLRHKALEEATQLREQLTAIVRSTRPKTIGAWEEQLPPPDKRILETLKNIVAAGFIDQVAIRADLSPTPPGEETRKPKRAIDVPYITLFLSSIGSTRTEEVARYVYIYPSSMLAHTAPKTLPKYLVYSHLSRSNPSGPISTISDTVSQTKTRLHPLTPIPESRLAELVHGTPLMEFGKPLGGIRPLPRENGYERRECTVGRSVVGEKGGQSWPLSTVRVVQRRRGTVGWVVEKVVG
ncbi:P-loop containing nucleoside triphosphate hydrolase protein [Patellaria atrata CBS 101060]|uniref:RNA helicase n=1 Tax=Patellaria atrata CBS 101060 TaxID=1346257 RepID=A0A9P4VL11_9PEZI|nr:P-loop containing nucleoside triphosphate hydrolase protein [Patellaria atrata CBS 101060]